MTIHTHTFNGRPFGVRTQAGLRAPDLAECNYARRVIRIPVDGDTLSELDWIIHEAIHAAMPWLAEWIVNRAAGDIARLLWRLGWRRE